MISRKKKLYSKKISFLSTSRTMMIYHDHTTTMLANQNCNLYNFLWAFPPSILAEFFHAVILLWAVVLLIERLRDEWYDGKCCETPNIVKNDCLQYYQNKKNCQNYFIHLVHFLGNWCKKNNTTTSVLPISQNF